MKKRPSVMSRAMSGRHRTREEVPYVSYPAAMAWRSGRTAERPGRGGAGARESAAAQAASTDGKVARSGHPYAGAHGLSSALGYTSCGTQQLAASASGDWHAEAGSAAAQFLAYLDCKKQEMLEGMAAGQSGTILD